MEKVSIISPVYNASKYLKACIESVLEQTYENFELILINDKSTDDSLNICKSYSDDRIKIIDLEKNVGVCEARNIGIKSSSGRYIAFLDSDDMWKKDKLFKQIKFMQEKNAKVSCTAYERVNEKGNFIGDIRPKNIIIYEDMLKNNYVGCLTLIYDTNFFGKKYFKQMNKNEDYLLWLELIKQSKYIYCLNEILASYRVLKNSRSSSKIKVIISRWEIYRKYEHLNIFKSFYYFVNYAIIALFKNRRKDEKKYR